MTMQGRKFGLGQGVEARRGRAIRHRTGPLHVRRCRARRIARLFRALPVAHAEFSFSDLETARSDAGRAGDLHGRGFRRLRRSAVPRRRSTTATARKPALKPYPVMATGTVDHVGDIVAMAVADSLLAGARRGRGDRRRMARTADRRRYGGGDPSRRSAGLRGRARQRLLRHVHRRRGEDGRSVRSRGAAGEDPHRQSARRRQLHGGALRARRIRCGGRQVHAACAEPGRAWPAGRGRRHDHENAAGQAARADQRRRRRLRHQDLRLSRISARCWRRRGAWANRSPGSPTAPSISSATRRAATM